MITLSKCLIRMVMFVLIVLAFTSQLLAQDEPTEPPIYDPDNPEFFPLHDPEDTEAILLFDPGDFSHSPDVVIPTDLRNQNCTTPISTLGGQGHQVSPVSGGLTTMQPSAFTLPALDLSQEELTALNSTDTGPVAILVVDSFNDSLNPVYDLSGVFDVTTEVELTDAVDTREISHGALVMNHINVLLGEMGYSPVEESVEMARSAGDPNVYYYYVSWDTGSTQIYVVAVDAISYGPIEHGDVLKTTEEAKTEIVEVLSKFVNDFDVHRFVVNMSFAILPCEELLDFWTTEAASTQGSFNFGDYLASISGVDLIAPSVPTPDPLMHFLSVPNEVLEYFGGFEDRAFVPVASSGNSKLEFPFWPAISSRVLSVGAPEAPPLVGALASPDAPRYANDGDFAENGGWYQLAKPADMYQTNAPDDNQTRPVNIYYLGTSFSAPTMSTRIALWLSTNVDEPCISNPGDIPQVAFAGPHEEGIEAAVDAKSIPLFISQSLADMVWSNRDLFVTRNNRC